MDRDELAALDKDALIELILRLYERVRELEAKVGRPPKTPGNSSIPPSAGYKANRALRLHRERGRITAATFANRRVRIERAADRLIFGFPLGVGEAWQLQKRYRRHRARLFVCLHREDVEPTNN